jgi:hypothetical protein
MIYLRREFQLEIGREGDDKLNQIEKCVYVSRVNNMYAFLIDCSVTCLVTDEEMIDRRILSIAKFQ